MPNLKIYLFAKKFFVKEFSVNTHGSEGTAQIVRWPSRPIILSIGNFESPTEAQMNSW